MPGIKLTVSPESIVNVIALTEIDISAEQGDHVLTAKQHNAFALAIQSGRPHSAIKSDSTLSVEDRQAILKELTARHLPFKAWLDAEFHTADELTKDLAKILFDRAQKMVVDAGHYVEAFQRRLLQDLIRTYLLGAIPVKLTSGTKSFEANQITVEATITVSPSLTISNPGAIADMLASLFNVALDLSFQYAPP